ncbi:hypothetical protein NQ318_016322 [Aromia moschata]|uniref:Transposase n=1 Tax=Aromia moschata TaxID=1265417 RepID=A0AAV8Z3C0_9CUCU|nr:hypothetical protein NQ318_016322 [Aromia moschata]
MTSVSENYVFWTCPVFGIMPSIEIEVGDFLMLIILITRYTCPESRPTVPEDVQPDVLLAIGNNPHATTRQVGRDLDVRHSTVHRILKRQKYRPYKFRLTPELAEGDFDSLMEFCESMQNR